MHFETGERGMFDGGEVLDRRMDLDVSHVSVPAILVVREDGDLDHESPDGFVVDVLQRNDHPSRRLIELHLF